jgi:hypothetical protein
MSIALFRLNAGSVITLTKKQIIDYVEVSSDVEEQLEDKSYTFLYMGKRNGMDAEYLLAPYNNDIFNEKIYYTYAIDDAECMNEVDIKKFKEMIAIRLLDALSSFMEEPGFDHDEYIEYEMDVARLSMKSVKLIEELNENQP